MRKFFVVAMMLSLSAYGLADTVVFDQIGANNSFTNGLFEYASQDFESSFDAYDINTIDNFTVTAPTPITQVEAVIGFWNGGSVATPTGWRVEFYNTAAAAGANLTGNAAHFQIAGNLSPAAFGTDGLGGTTYKVTIPVTGVTLPAGSYYVGVMGVMPFTGGGQVGIMNSTLGDGGNAYQANPGGGFGSGTYFQPGGVNAAYRVWTPEPTSLVLLALAGLIRRR